MLLIMKFLSFVLELGTKRKKLYRELEKWIDKREKRLNYWDFLYFSAGISATTTFGDIYFQTQKLCVHV